MVAQYPPISESSYGSELPQVPRHAYANWIIRVISYVIDYALPWIIAGIAQAVFNGHVGIGRALLGTLLSLVSIAVIAYNRWILLGRTGQSWGKALTHTRLLGMHTGEPIGAFKSFLRDILHILDALFFDIGFLWPIWGRRRQTLFGDKIMRTVVVKI
jgi:uncharacterized RDD family membrane protein YckC